MRAATVGLMASFACSRPPPPAAREIPAPDSADAVAQTWAPGDTGVACDRQGALVYRPTDLAGAALLRAAGWQVTVWGEEEWSQATTADFAAFSLILVGEQSCDGPDARGELGPLEATQALWQPAIDGRVLVMGLDPQCHAVDWEAGAAGNPNAPGQLLANSLRWLAEPCATSALFATDWGRRGAGYLAGFGPFAERAQRGDRVSLAAPDAPLFAGMNPLDLNQWSSTYHSVFVAWPADFEALAVPEGDGAVILAREVISNKFASQ